MKKSKLLPVVSLAMALMLAGCGNTTSSSKAPAGSSKKTSSVVSKTSSKGSTSTHTHTFDETKWESNETQHWHPATCEHTTQKGSAAAHTFVADGTKKDEAATCQKEGVKYEKCSVCGYAKTTQLPKTDHDWEIKNTIEKVDGVSSKYTIKECKTCKAKDVSVDAMTYTAIDYNTTDTSKMNKDSSGATLKFGQNGGNATYVITLDGDFEGELYMHGWVDYWKDGSTNNNNRGIYSTKNGTEGEDANLEITINGEPFEITNKKSYEESGLTDGDGTTGNNCSAFGYVLCGALKLSAGTVTINYKRIESYNLNIDALDLIGTMKDPAPHNHSWVAGTPVSNAGETPYTVDTCTCGKKRVMLDITNDLNGKLSKGGKLNKNGDTARYAFTFGEAKAATLWVKGTVDNAGNYGYGFYTGKDASGKTVTLEDGATNTSFAVNSTNVPAPVDKTYGDLGMTGIKEDGAATFAIGACNLINGLNEVTITRNNSYGIQYYEVFLVY